MQKAYCRRRAGAAVRVFDIGAGALGQLLEQERALKALFLDLALEACQTHTNGIVGLFHVGHALLQIHTFPAVGLLDGGRQAWDAW